MSGSDNNEEALLSYALRLGDNALVLGQRLIELVTHHPELEEELANANISLDYIGQARMFYSYAGELEGRGRTEDDFAYRREDNEYQNLLLLEQPNGHFGDTIVRQVLFDSFYVLQLEALLCCKDPRLAEIAARAIKEVRYHLRHSSNWLTRLGDGTTISHERVGQSLRDLWQFTGEFFAGDDIDDCIRDVWAGPDLSQLRDAWRSNLNALLKIATLELPEDASMASGGRQGSHSEHMGNLIAELQQLQRSCPRANW